MLHYVKRGWLHGAYTVVCYVQNSSSFSVKPEPSDSSLDTSLQSGFNRSVSSSCSQCQSLLHDCWLDRRSTLHSVLKLHLCVVKVDCFLGV